MSKVSLALLTAFIAAPLATSVAHADSPAYTAAKANLGDGANVLVAINVGSITTSETFKTMWPMLQQKADMKEGLELAKSACGLDAMTVVSDVVVAMDKNAEQTGVIFVGLKGIDQAKVESCTAAIGKAKGKPVPTFKKEGDMISVTEPTGKKETKYYKWIGTGVIAISMKGDKDSLAKWTGGKGAFAKSTLGGMAAKANASAAVWGAASVGGTLQPGVDVKSGYGWVTLDKGQVGAEAHATMTDAKTATATADKANQQITAVKGNKQMPPAITGLLANIKVAASGSEVVVKGSMKESDIMSLAAMLGKF